MLLRDIAPTTLISFVLLNVLGANFIISSIRFGGWSSRGNSATTTRSPDPTVSHGFAQELFDQAAKLSTGNGFPLFRQLRSDSESDADEPRNSGHYSRPMDAAPPSSHDTRETFISAADAAEDIWAALIPSNSNLFATDTTLNAEKPHPAIEPISSDEALQHMRHIIQILSRTHNALLDKKLAKLTLLQRLWYKLFYLYKDPLIGGNTADQKHQHHTALSNLANSARDFISVAGNNYVIKENVNTVTATFAKEMLLSVSALRDAARSAAHGGWLVTSDVKGYVGELTQNFSALSDKWLYKLGMLADAAKPVATNVSDNEHVQDVLKVMEEMVADFQDEMWRMRTEWIYKRSETLSWATESFHGIKQLGMHEVGRLSENVHGHVDGAKHILREGLERNRALLAYLQQHAAERMNHFVGLLALWVDVSKGLLRAFARMLKSYVEKLWRIGAFVAVVVFCRFLLQFFFVDSSVRPSASSVTTEVVRSPSAGSGSTSESSPGTSQSESSTTSESSESNPIMEETALENDSPRTSELSQVRETVSPSNDITVNSTAQLQRRGTRSRTPSTKIVRAARPLRVSNVDYQATKRSGEQQKEGQPICIGEHEVQLVYDDTPRDSLPDKSRNNSSRTARSRASRTTGFESTARREEKRVASERGAEVSDDDNSTTMTSGYDTANSRLTRSSARRASARRRSQLR